MLIKPFCHKQTSVLWQVAGGQLRPVGLQGQLADFPSASAPGIGELADENALKIHCFYKQKSQSHSGQLSPAEHSPCEKPLVLSAKEPRPSEKPLVFIAKEPKPSSAVTGSWFFIKFWWRTPLAQTQNDAPKRTRVYARGHIYIYIQFLMRNPNLRSKNAKF